MRILHIASGYEFSGISVALATMANSRPSQSEIEQKFCLFYPGKTKDILDEQRTSVYLLNEDLTRRPWSGWSERRQLQRLLDEWQPHSIHCHGLAPWVRLGKLLEKLSLPKFLWVHKGFHHDVPLEERALKNPPDFCVANSKFVASTLGSVGGRPVVVMNPPTKFAKVRLPADNRNAIRRKLDTPLTDVVVTQVGRFDEYKGFHVLLSALCQTADLSQLSCWIVGYAENPEQIRYEKRLKRFVTENGLQQRVRFLGFQSNIANLLSAADLYCQPNVTPEPYGLTFVEALSQGLPVITTQQGGPKEIVPKDCALFTAPNQPEEVAQALRKLTINSALRSTMAKKAPLSVQKLGDPQDFWERLEELLVVCPLEHRRPA